MSNFAKALRVALPLLIFIIIVVFLWRGLSRNPHRVPSPFINRALPKFNAETLKHPNKVITNQDLKGHVSLLNVFATWCLSCRAEHPVLMEIHNSHLVKIYGLNYKDQRQLAESWLIKFGNPYSEVIYDPKGTVGINLGVYGTPETFIIDAKGIIRYKYIGPISPEEWRDTIKPEVEKLKRASA